MANVAITLTGVGSIIHYQIGREEPKSSTDVCGALLCVPWRQIVLEKMGTHTITVQIVMHGGLTGIPNPRILIEIARDLKQKIFI